MSQLFHVLPADVFPLIKWLMVAWPTGGGWDVGPRLIRRGPMKGDYLISADIRDIIPEATKYSRLLDKLPTIELDYDAGNGMADPPELTVVAKAQKPPTDLNPTPPADLLKP